jgi:hypothetical protein
MIATYTRNGTGLGSTIVGTTNSQGMLVYTKAFASNGSDNGTWVLQLQDKSSNHVSNSVTFSVSVPAAPAMQPWMTGLLGMALAGMALVMKRRAASHSF